MTQRKIYCLKVSQKMLDTPIATYWPYDRAYLIHRDDFHVAPHMFRYYFHMALTPELLHVLNRVEVNAHRTMSLVRDDEKFKYVKGTSQGQFTWIDDPENWKILVPTHVKGRYKNNKAVASFIQYFSTNAINAYHHNDKIELPQVSLHTPKRDIEFFCAICTNLTQYHEGACKPATQSCKQKIDTELPFDDHFRRALRKSVEEAGGE